MATRQITEADTTNMSSATPYAIPPAQEDSKGIDYMPRWRDWFGYYKNIPELQAVIDKKAIWVIGKGYKMKSGDKKTLDKIRGNGKDTFNIILQNLVRQYTICGDAFAEIVKDKNGKLINLKPLNPGTMIIKSDKFGFITGYEQLTQTDKPNIIFSTDDILHLSWNRISDEVHGISVIEKLDKIIKYKNEAQDDMAKIFHRYVKPLWVFSVDTDNPTEIANFKAKIDLAVTNCENLIIPKDTVANIERVSLPQYSTLDPLPWIELLNRYFLMCEGIPEVILGIGNQTTEATSKIVYLAFQQVIEWNQLFLEEQLKAQLDIEIELEFPASLEPNLQKDNAKDGQLNSQKNSPQINKGNIP